MSRDYQRPGGKEGPAPHIQEARSLEGCEGAREEGWRGRSRLGCITKYFESLAGGVCVSGVGGHCRVLCSGSGYFLFVFVLKFFPIMVYDRVLDIVPCALQ